MKQRRPLDYALFLLGQRGYSEEKLKEKLEAKFNDRQETDQVIAKLKNMNLINDESYARSYLISKSRYNHRGKHRINLELKLLGISQEIINRVTSEYSEEDQLLIAADLITRRLERYQKLDKNVIYRRLVSLLARQGFDAKIISAALDQIKLESIDRSV